MVAQVMATGLSLLVHVLVEVEDTTRTHLRKVGTEGGVGPPGQ